MHILNNFLSSGYSLSKDENLQKFRFSLLNSMLLISTFFTLTHYLASIFGLMPGNVINHSETYTIEAVNVSKTTQAGTFNTFRVKIEDIEVGGTAWIDINSGYDVLTEFKSTSGEEGGSLELIEKNF